MTIAGRSQDLVIERTFEAPPEVIWRMWTEAQHFASWYGPADAKVTVAAMDVRVGGSRLLRMEVMTPQGTVHMWFAGQYVEVVENQRLVYTDAVSDEHGRFLTAEEAGMPSDHPTTTEVRVDLWAADGGTGMRLTHVGIPTGSPGAAGWTMALDKLGVRLSERQHS
jgi:uncharacterized protein YndB with AHSA1/START domain